jgi:hypothetical protein
MVDVSDDRDRIAVALGWSSTIVQAVADLKSRLPLDDGAIELWQTPDMQQVVANLAKAKAEINSITDQAMTLTVAAAIA